MFVCLCKAITDHEIRDAVDQGVTSFADMQSHLNVSTVCGGCSCEVKLVMEKKLKAECGSRPIATEISFNNAIA